MTRIAPRREFSAPAVPIIQRWQLCRPAYAGAMDIVRLRHSRLAMTVVLWASAAFAAAAPVALVTDVVGAAAARGAPLKLLAEIGVGTEIDVAADSRVVVFYVRDGSEWTLSGRGRYRLDARAPVPHGSAPAPQRKAVTAPLAGVKLRTAGAVQGGLQLRGGGDRPALIAPVNDMLLDGNVTFAWEAASPGTSYRFELVDASGTKVYVADTEASTLRLPAEVALVRGARYAWAVSGRDLDAPQPFYRAAEFRVADEATRDRLRAAQPAADAPFPDRVLYVAILEDAGAKGTARALRTQLATERTAVWAPPR
jgi:hypothetical protein